MSEAEKGGSDHDFRDFVQEVTETLLGGGKHSTPGLGTFSTCTRKATESRPACTMAMFRASPELREYAIGGPLPEISGPHAEAVSAILGQMVSHDGVCVPHLGRLAIVPVEGKKPKLIFHGATELNRTLDAK